MCQINKPCLKLIQHKHINNSLALKNSRTKIAYIESIIKPYKLNNSKQKATENIPEIFLKSRQ